MDVEHGGIQLKEASVILTKVDDQVLSRPSPRKVARLERYTCDTIQEPIDNDEMIHSLPSKRKRHRKNTTPKRISRTVSNFYDYVDDGITSDLLDPYDPMEEEKCDIVNSTTRSFPYCHEIIVNCPSGNNNAKISNKHTEGMEDEGREVVTPKFSTTPIFVKRTKTATPDAKQPTSTSVKVNEDTVIHSAPLTRHATGKHGSESSKYDKNIVMDKHVKKKTKRNIPNILSRTKKLSTKAQKYKYKKPEVKSPVEIRPKTVQGTNLTSATRAAFENTLSKQVVSSTTSRNSNVIFPVLHQKPTNHEHLPTFEKRESTNNSPKRTDPKLNFDMNDTKISNVPSSFIPLTVKQFPSTSLEQSEVKPTVSKPQYRSRLRSKSGTKYIVRKDSVISTDLSDLFEPPSSSLSNAGNIQQILLKLPENSEKKFYDHFVKPSNLDANTVNNVFEEIQSCSGLPGSTTNQQSSPILKLTHSKNEVVWHSPPPVHLVSQGGLEDVKREMNIEKPNTWNVQDESENGNKLSGNTMHVATPTEKFIANLQARFMPKMSQSRMMEQQGVVQTYCVPFWSECHGMELNNTFTDFNAQPFMQTKVDTGKQKDYNFLTNGDDNKIIVTKNSNTPRVKDCKIMTKGCREDNKIVVTKRSNALRDKDSKMLARGGREDDKIIVTKNFNTPRVKIKQEPADMPTRQECGTGNPYSDSGHKDVESRQIQKTDTNCRNRQYRAIKQEIIEASEQVNDKPATVKSTYKCIKPKDITPYIKKECMDTADRIKIEVVKSNEIRKTSTKPVDIKHGTQNDNVVKQISNDEYTRGGISKQGSADDEMLSEQINGKFSKDNYCSSFDPTGIHNISVKMESTEFFEVKDKKSQSESHINDKQSLNDHAYTRSDIDVMSASSRDEKDSNNTVSTTVEDIETNEENDHNKSEQNTNQKPVISNMPSIPVYAIRCGEKVVLFPASKAMNAKKTTNAIIRPSTPNKTPNEISKSSSAKKQPVNKRPKPDKQKTEFAGKCELACSSQTKTKKSEASVNDLVNMNYNSIVSKRPKNHQKHMCAVIVQVTRREDNKFSFTKDILALSFTNGSNPFLVRWHNDGIHVAMVTFNSRGYIQHLTVDNITPGFYCLTLKNDSMVRKNRTFEGLLTSTLPNEDLLLTERDFIAIGEIKSIMDPTISKLDISINNGLTVSEALSDILPSELMQMYNPTISDRSYRPKVDDKIWYSTEKFETFTSIYGRTRGFQINGSRFPGEEIV